MYEKFTGLTAVVLRHKQNGREDNITPALEHQHRAVYVVTFGVITYTRDTQGETVLGNRFFVQECSIWDGIWEIRISPAHFDTRTESHRKTYVSAGAVYMRTRNQGNDFLLF